MEERAPYTVKTMFPPILPSEPKNTANYVLKTEPESVTMPSFFKTFLENQRVMMRMGLADIERLLGYNPKRCPHCGGELK